MGTNFYIKGEVCPHCYRGDPDKHIGKSSAGWVFALRVYPEQGINDLDDWLPIFEAGVIVDEYGRTLTMDEMLAKIKDRSWPKPPTLSALYENQAEIGPNNLLRTSMSFSHGPVKHGAGTWDCFDHEFS